MPFATNRRRKPKNALGRKLLPPERVRRWRLDVPISEEELDAVRAAARLDGKALTVWAREVLLREAGR